MTKAPVANAHKSDPSLTSKLSPSLDAKKRSLSPKKTSASVSRTKKARRNARVNVSKSRASKTSKSNKQPATLKSEKQVYESDPESALDIPDDYDEEASIRSTGTIRTVHWDPNSEEGQKVGYRIRVYNSKEKVWESGRIIRYDPISHKHKIYFFTDEEGMVDDDEHTQATWLDLKKEYVQIGGRFVWALVKGYPWWPGQVLEISSYPTEKKGKHADIMHPCRQGYVLVEFFDSDEVAPIKDTPDFIRPFNNGKVDSVIARNKRKRSQKAIEVGNQEYQATFDVRNDVVKYYASKAFKIANVRAKNLLGKNVEVFNNEINYPQGSIVKGIVRQFSSTSKKWLVAYDDNSFHEKVQSSWVHLLSKGSMHKVLDRRKCHQPDRLDLHSFSFGNNDMKMLCRGCAKECDTNQPYILKCNTCSGVFHPGCLDPPISQRTAENIMKGDEKWTCPKCTPCMGCRELDIVFGTKIIKPPSSLALEVGQSLKLCSSCIPRYEKDMYCPICAHVWDDIRYKRVQDRIKNEKRSSGNIVLRCESNKGVIDESKYQWPLSSAIDPAAFYPENNIFGYNESTMLSCDKCNLWVHSACAGLSESEYNQTNEGKHPIYSKEFLCRTCCRKQCQLLVEKLQEEDKMFLFAIPVTDKIAHNYHDIIKNPMDLQTILEECDKGMYRNYSWLRESFELMVYNALTFNVAYSAYWNEARRYYNACLSIFKVQGKGAPVSKYASLIDERFIKAKLEVKAEQERIQEDKTTEKKDLFAGATVSSIELGPLVKPTDPPSCVPCTNVMLTSTEAFYCAWMESCFMCGSSGAADTMLFCVDCGEAYHSFCAAAPIHSMNQAAINSWRCANCKTCEISGEVPADETKLLYCDMCDRGFSLDSLDPPLSTVPKGLWICGQCVDCKSCGNTSNGGKISRASWSKDPQKCRSCGGCEDWSTSLRCKSAEQVLSSKMSSGTKAVKTKKISTKAKQKLVQKVEKTAKPKKLAIKKLEKNAKFTVKKLEKSAKPKNPTIKKEKKPPIPKNLIVKKEKKPPKAKKVIVKESDEEALVRVMKEAKARGLPDGWTVFYGKARRKFWRAPNPESRRTFDSIPKALVYAEKMNAQEPFRFETFQKYVYGDQRWLHRESFDDEYKYLINDAEILNQILKERMGFRFHLMFEEVQIKSNIPGRLIARAARFTRKKSLKKSRKKAYKVKVDGLANNNNLPSRYLKGEMASAFLYIACRFLRLDINKTITCWEKMKVLLSTSTVTGSKIPLHIDGLFVDFAYDRLESVSDRNHDSLVEKVMKQSMPIPLIPVRERKFQVPIQLPLINSKAQSINRHFHQASAQHDHVLEDNTVDTKCKKTDAAHALLELTLSRSPSQSSNGALGIQQSSSFAEHHKAQTSNKFTVARASPTIEASCIVESKQHLSGVVGTKPLFGIAPSSEKVQVLKESIVAKTFSSIETSSIENPSSIESNQHSSRKVAANFLSEIVSVSSTPGKAQALQKCAAGKSFSPIESNQSGMEGTDPSPSTPPSSGKFQHTSSLTEIDHQRIKTLKICSSDVASTNAVVSSQMLTEGHHKTTTEDSHQLTFHPSISNCSRQHENQIKENHTPYKIFDSGDKNMATDNSARNIGQTNGIISNDVSKFATKHHSQEPTKSVKGTTKNKIALPQAKGPASVEKVMDNLQDTFKKDVCTTTKNDTAQQESRKLMNGVQIKSNEPRQLHGHAVAKMVGLFRQSSQIKSQILESIDVDTSLLQSRDIINAKTPESGLTEKVAILDENEIPFINTSSLSSDKRESGKAAVYFDSASKPTLNVPTSPLQSTKLKSDNKVTESLSTAKNALYYRNTEEDAKVLGQCGVMNRTEPPIDTSTSNFHLMVEKNVNEVISKPMTMDIVEANKQQSKVIDTQSNQDSNYGDQLSKMAYDSQIINDYKCPGENLQAIQELTSSVDIESVTGHATCIGNQSKMGKPAIELDPKLGCVDHQTPQVSMSMDITSSTSSTGLTTDVSTCSKIHVPLGEHCQELSSTGTIEVKCESMNIDDSNEIINKSQSVDLAVNHHNLQKPTNMDLVTTTPTTEVLVRKIPQLKIKESSTKQSQERNVVSNEHGGQMYKAISEVNKSINGHTPSADLRVNHQDVQKEGKSVNDNKPSVKLPWYNTDDKKVEPLIGWTNQGGMQGESVKWLDPRICCLCMISGDDDAGVSEKTKNIENINASLGEELSGCGRLLPLPGGTWVHAGCAVWSSEVWEDSVVGCLQDVHLARTRGAKLKCFGCGRPGATLGCHKTHCNANYHFACAKASGAVFTDKHKLYCNDHKDCATDSKMDSNSFQEYMKTLRIQPPKKGLGNINKNSPYSCSRVGALVVHSMGRIEQKMDGFHSEQYITPPGFCSSRIFWSFVTPRTRTVYVMRIDRTEENKALFSVVAADAPQSLFQDCNISLVFKEVIDRVYETNNKFFSRPDDMFSIYPRRRSEKKSFHGLNGPQFFGFGMDHIRTALENMPEALACAVPLTKDSTPYQFCFVRPQKEDAMDIQRKRAAVLAEKELENTSGCARTEGSSAVTKSSGSGRITRALVRKAEEDVSCKIVPEDKVSDIAGNVSKREFDSNQAKYSTMKSVPLDQRLVAKRSHIHGWGLFTKIKLSKHSMIIEYMGEMVRQPIADLREKEYEKSGLGSCYMFRLDKEYIVDATAVGCMARFMNHSCAANAYSKVVSVQTEEGLEKKIAVFANRDIEDGEEITYDYKFPVEDGSLRCTCGAPNCIGRMN